jgi:hypothetical protein
LALFTGLDDEAPFDWVLFVPPCMALGVVDLWRFCEDDCGITLGEGWTTCKGSGWTNLGLFPLLVDDDLGDFMVMFGDEDEGFWRRENRVSWTVLDELKWSCTLVIMESGIDGT